MMRRRLVLLALVGIACRPLGDHTVSAQTVEELFDDHVIQDVRLFINERDLRELRDRYRENIYVPADFEWRGLHVRNVAVRPRGLATRSPVKLGLKVDFNRYATGQSFLGYTSLVLDNLLQDPSLVRERLSMALFERVGEPASRESFARVYINNVYEGVFAIVEPVSGEFLTRTRGNNTGYLFERHFLHSYYGEDLGDDPASYRPVFEPRNHELESDTILYSPIRDLFHEVNQPLDTVWRERVSRYIDLEQFVTHVAIETYLSEVDGVLGFAGMANFYLYREATGDRHQLIVWDKDQTFAAIDSPIFQRASENILFSRALSFGDLRALYLDVLERCARSAATDGWLEREIGRLSTLIEAPAREDVRKPFDEAARQESVEFLVRFARERSAFVLREVARERGAR